MARERERLNVSVGPDTKEEWKSAVDESPEYSSISQLIRKSVAAELSDDDTDTAAPNTTPSARAEAATADDVGEVREDTREILQRLTELQSDIQPVLSAVQQQETADIDALANEIYAELPRSQAAAEDAHAGENDATGDPAELADRLGASELEVRQAITELRDAMPGTLGALPGVSQSGDDYYYIKGR